MVRSSSSKPTKEKSTASTRSDHGTKSTKAAQTGQVEKSPKPKLKEKETPKKSPIKAKSVLAPKVDKKVAVPKKGAADKEAKVAAASKKKSPPATSEKKAPKTQELFEESSVELDSPAVSVLPALTDESIDPTEADALAKTPPEFQNPDVLLPTAKESAATPIETPQEPPVEITFSYLGFSDQILEAISKQNFAKPTRVQSLCLPFTLDGKDVAGFAQTGTGKTAVYLLTAAQKLLNQENRQIQPHKPHVLVVVPTRELADQVTQDAKRLLAGLKLKSLAVFGGVDVERHIAELNQAVDLVVATPGRLLDLHRSKKLELDDLQLLVIDECDRMFDMGFIDDVEYILRHLPAERVQKLLFSATGSEKVKELAFEYLDEPEYIETDPVRITPEKITQVAFAVTAEQKFNTLMGHIRSNNPECAIIFTNTKVVAEWVGYKLACNGLNAEVLTGDLPQKKRMSLIKKIKEGKCNLLVATDVLSRGLHVANLSHVYNFDVPDDAESFIHRIGRTARAGATGHAITLICDDYGYNMGAVETLLGFSIPLTPVPETYLTAEDKSDYPFDSSGRVKSFGHTQAAAHQDIAEEHSRPTARPQTSERREERPSTTPEQISHKRERPESTHPAHSRRDIAHGAQEPRVSHSRPSQDTRRDGGPTIAAASPVPTSHKPTLSKDALDRPQPISSQRPSMPTPQGQAEGQRQAHALRTPQSPSHPRSTQAQQNSGMTPHRRDEKAKETIDLAIQAAKKAAARRQAHTTTGTKTTPSLFKIGKTRVTEQIDEIAAAVLTGAQEKLGGAFDQLQDRFAARFEENFPRLSETLVRLGFLSKRYTDDR